MKTPIHVATLASLIAILTLADRRGDAVDRAGNRIDNRQENRDVRRDDRQERVDTRVGY